MNNHEIQHFRIHEPYCLKQVERDQYIKLNRNYNPLGVETQETVRYEDFPVVSLTPQTAAALSVRSSRYVDAVYLYNDGCVPTSSDANMRVYLAKVALLAKLEVASRPVPVR